MNEKYILNERGEPVIEPDLIKWAKGFENPNRVVKREKVGDVIISTIFLGLDHNCCLFEEKGPILWETMIFGGAYDEYQTRCGGSREQAEAMHNKAVRMVKKTKSI